MAKINTTNYQPVTAWNGTQDLLIVEQPDGTKVATPEQVKQYVEAGDFEATGEVIDGHGNILAKKADITTVTIPRFTPSQAGWRRICKVKPVDMHTVEGMIYVGGYWSNGLPPSASVAVNIMYNYASLTLLSSVKGDDIRITAMRLVRVSGAEYWLDVYLPAYSQITGSFTLKFIGDIVVSDIQDPISITTDSTTASAEISLNQKVSGTVLTDKSDVADTDEFTIELPSGWTKPGKSPYALQFIKRGKIVCVYCTGAYIGSINQSVNVGTLPTKFKPLIRTEIKIMNLVVAPITDYNPAVSFSFLLDGRIVIYGYGKTNVDMNFGTYIGSYPVA